MPFFFLWCPPFSFRSWSAPDNRGATLLHPPLRLVFWFDFRFFRAAELEIGLSNDHPGPQPSSSSSSNYCSELPVFRFRCDKIPGMIRGPARCAQQCAGCHERCWLTILSCSKPGEVAIMIVFQPPSELQVDDFLFNIRSNNPLAAAVWTKKTIKGRYYTLIGVKSSLFCSKLWKLKLF